VAVGVVKAVPAILPTQSFGQFSSAVLAQCFPLSGKGQALLLSVPLLRMPPSSLAQNDLHELTNF
jgi:hypothetical protein